MQAPVHQILRKSELVQRNILLSFFNSAVQKIVYLDKTLGLLHSTGAKIIHKKKLVSSIGRTELSFFSIGMHKRPFVFIS